MKRVPSASLSNASSRCPLRSSRRARSWRRCAGTAAQARSAKPRPPALSRAKAWRTSALRLSRFRSFDSSFSLPIQACHSRNAAPSSSAMPRSTAAVVSSRRLACTSLSSCHLLQRMLAKAWFLAMCLNSHHARKHLPSPASRSLTKSSFSCALRASRSAEASRCFCSLSLTQSCTQALNGVQSTTSASALSAASTLAWRALRCSISSLRWTSCCCQAAKSMAARAWPSLQSLAMTCAFLRSRRASSRCLAVCSHHARSARRSPVPASAASVARTWALRASRAAAASRCRCSRALAISSCQAMTAMRTAP
mmetsp:Transcript_112607/g.329108  ORF Transcript_112607/g.329108 Transcript_112607/m.329108 type:complete len:310 (-) Transcript_112607:1370-2299(-)